MKIVPAGGRARPAWFLYHDGARPPPVHDRCRRDPVRRDGHCGPSRVVELTMRCMQPRILWKLVHRCRPVLQSIAFDLVLSGLEPRAPIAVRAAAVSGMIIGIASLEQYRRSRRRGMAARVRRPVRGFRVLSRLRTGAPRRFSVCGDRRLEGRTARRRSAVVLGRLSPRHDLSRLAAKVWGLDLCASATADLLARHRRRLAACRRVGAGR